MINKFLLILFYYLLTQTLTPTLTPTQMNYTEILFDNTISDEKRSRVANEIINKYNLSLSKEQILLAHDIIHKWCPNKHFKNNRIVLLNKILNINTNLYIAVIVATCNNYKPYDLCYLMQVNDAGVCVDIGIYSATNCENFYKLLDYYEFDVSNISNISDEIKHKIEEYRQSKYSGKLTKSAIKND